MTGPFQIAAQAYYDSGWSPIPLPPKSKFPPADDFTGANGKFVDELMLKRWLSGKAKASAGNLNWVAGAGSIALRLPPSILGIDVDMYEGKAGRATFEAAIEAWGELPATWFTSSRVDGSGIRLYRIPEGLAWPGKLPQGGGVELIRWDHRYAVVGPTTHPDTGLSYRWFVEDQSLTSGGVTGGVADPWGLIAEEEFPDVDCLPELPTAWVEALTSGKRWEARAAADMDAGDVRLWLSDRFGPEVCSTMERTLKRYLLAVRKAGDDGGSHDAGRDGAWALIGDAQAGHSGIEKALNMLKKAFMPAVERRSDRRLAGEEWARIVVRGVQKVAAEGEANGECVCSLLSSGKQSRDSRSRSDADGNDGSQRDQESDGGRSDKPSSSGHGPLFFARTDAGNAERLALAWRHEQKYVARVGWLVWSHEQGRWVADVDGVVDRRAIEVARSIGDEAVYLDEENPKEATELRKFARASENEGKMRAMINVCRSLKGMTLPITEFDADPARLGNLVLKRNPGVEVVPALPEHRITLRLGAAFVRGASMKAWSRFLSSAQPDEEIRDWLQRLLGYSLYGGNSGRLFIANFGPSSTGKTTFLQAVLTALGEYATMVNMTVYRDNQDDKPRPDLLRALRKRLIFSEETSSAWHLHADQVKRITGGAPLVARYMKSDDFVEMVPAFTPWIFVNAPPSIDGADMAVLRRLVVVPWDVVIAPGKEDLTLIDRLKGEEGRAAVLAWALEGWEKYCAQGDLSAPVGAWNSRLEFLSELSDFDRALAEIAVVEEEAYVTPLDLYNAYKHWCSVTGNKVESSTKFGTWLTGRGYPKKGKKLDGKPTWVRSGLRLTHDYRKLFSTN